MRDILRGKTFVVLAILASLALAPPLAADKQKSDKLLSALASLAALENALPPDRKPKAGMTEEEKARNAEAFLKAGVSCHDIMGAFSEPLGKKADQYLRASLAFRESPVTRAYLGSSHLIQARDVPSIIAKVSEVDIGLKEVDAAVKSAPNDILPRAIRIECTIGLPSMFKRLDGVTDDLAILLKAYANAPQAFDGTYSPARLFELKAEELKQRGKNAMADKYREKAKELKAGALPAADGKSDKE